MPRKQRPAVWACLSHSNLVNYPGELYHRSAYLSSLPQILKLANISVFIPSLHPLTFFSATFVIAHLSPRDVGGLSGIWQWLQVVFISGEHMSLAPNTHSQKAKLYQLPLKMPLLLHPSVFALLLPSALWSHLKNLIPGFGVWIQLYLLSFP